MTDRPLRGVLPVFQTPFASDGGPDLEVLESEINWILDQGADGLVMGMVSEVLRLSPAEIDLVGAKACEVAARRGAPAVMSVGAESTHVAVTNARRATDFGASALMAIPPLATAASDSEILKYYEGILRSVPIPVIVQDASGYVGHPLSIDVQTRLLHLFPDQVMFKPEAPPIGPRVTALRDATGGRAKIFEGTGGIALVDSYPRGIIGTMPGADLSWAAVRLWQALEARDQSAIDEINGALVPLIAIQSNLDAFLAVEKHLLWLQGVFLNSDIRGPVAYTLDPETQHEVERLFWQLKSVVAKHDHSAALEHSRS